jgi:hypothetical protein
MQSASKILPSVSSIPVGMCQCGCGSRTSLATATNRPLRLIKGLRCRFVKGHNSRTKAWGVADPNPSGLCMCGCGESTPLAPHSCKRNGWVKGSPIKFIHGHHTGALKTTHGASRGGRWTPEFRAYVSARCRCTNRNDVKHWKNYGGRGIQFRFKSFEEFFAELGPRPSSKYSVDRYPNNDGHYEKGNVRWATSAEQANNTRRNKKPGPQKISDATKQKNVG